MACSTCIRGHRSASCQHTDRPLLKLRRKGRPIAHCDQCRDLRKALHVYSGCLCEPDKSEAPKRKGNRKTAQAEVSTSSSELVHYPPSSSSALTQNLLDFMLETQPTRSATCPQSFQTTSAIEEMVVPELSQGLQTPTGLSFDPKTVALWEEFLSDGFTNDIESASQPNIQDAAPVPAICACCSTSDCVVCSPEDPCCSPSQLTTIITEKLANCTGFDCCELMVAISRIATDLLVAGNNLIPQSAFESKPDQVEINPSPPELVSELPGQLNVGGISSPRLSGEYFTEQLEFGSTVPIICTYGDDCVCDSCISKALGTELVWNDDRCCMGCPTCSSEETTI